MRRRGAQDRLRRGCADPIGSRPDSKIRARPDAALGEPLAGVIVVAHREVESPYNGATVAQVIVMETTTDKQGKFAFPAWGLKRPHTSLAPLAVAPWTGRLRYQAPALLLFKSDWARPLAYGFNVGLLGGYALALGIDAFLIAYEKIDDTEYGKAKPPAPKATTIFSLSPKLDIGHGRAGLGVGGTF